MILSPDLEEFGDKIWSLYLAISGDHQNTDDSLAALQNDMSLSEWH